MSLNLETKESKILYLPLKNETLPNLKPHTTLTPAEHSKLNDIKSNTFDVCTGITKQSYSNDILSEILRTLKPGGVLMIQIGKEKDLKKDLLYIGFTDIESNSQHQITHWTARKPKSKIKAARLNLNQNIKIVKEQKKQQAEEIITSYKTSKTSLGRFFIPCNNINMNSLYLTGSTLMIATVCVGNIGQIAMDILLTTLHANNKIIKIGFINDRNIECGIGNNGIIPKQKRNKSKNKTKTMVNMAVEVYYCKESNLVLIQQRCAVRMGGRGEYVNGLMQFIEKYEFNKVIVLTAEYITKRTDFETKNGIDMVYYCSDAFGDGVDSELKWMASLDDQKKDNEIEEKEQVGYRIVGHGITRKLFVECEKRKKAIIVVCEYSEDGDNTMQSEMYLDCVVQLVENIKNNEKKWIHPYSLAFANGGKLPNTIY